MFTGRKVYPLPKQGAAEDSSSYHLSSCKYHASSLLTIILQYTIIRIMIQDEWSIEYYVEDSGRVPVRDFLSDLDHKTYTRFHWSLEQLRLRNIRAREPLVRHVEGKLGELREESSTNIYRILYFFFSGRRIVLLHGFAKKSPKLPRRELEVAVRRLARFEEREGSE